MSYPPEVKLGKEDLNRWGMHIYERTSSLDPITIKEYYELDEEDGLSIAAFSLSIYGYSDRSIGRILKISPSTAKIWRTNIAKEMEATG